MVVIFTISFVIALVLVVAVAFVAGRVDVESSSSLPLSGMFISPRLPDRPRGVQEEDLPPFVFHSEASVLAS